MGMEVEERELEASLREQIEGRNYVAAVALAQKLGKPAERIKELQGAAIKQYIIEYRNAPGATALIGEFRFTADEVDRLLEAILEEVKTTGGKRSPMAGRRYDAKTMKYLDVEEWISQYGRTLKQAVSD
jgi:hypothetical protein